MGRFLHLRTSSRAHGGAIALGRTGPVDFGCALLAGATGVVETRPYLMREATV
jgi:hypothetical protein